MDATEKQRVAKRQRAWRGGLLLFVVLALVPVNPRMAAFKPAAALGDSFASHPHPLIAVSFAVLLAPSELVQAASHVPHHRYPRPPVSAESFTTAPESEVPNALGQFEVEVADGPVNRFNPMRALGAGVDAVAAGQVDKIYTPQNIRTMLSAGHGSLTYRLYTELSVQDWHWNPNGAWSDPAGFGYFTGSVTPGFIRHSFGYRLPHRGFTHDQGNDDDYSRLTDGNLATYWKSNPYLDRRYTGESNRLHPQWVIVDMGDRVPINAIRLAWANPYAREYRVEYWTGRSAIDDPAHGEWVPFPNGVVHKATGGTVTLALSNAPVESRFIRVTMRRSSHTFDSHGSHDPRNALGFALAEVGVGALVNGVFHDLVRHQPDSDQTVTYVSSVDPWSEPSNRVTDEEQPGLDLVLQSGLTRGLPSLLPVPMLYSTPQNAAAEVRYLQKQHYPIAGIEMGEEPDGQYMTPEDYGALYVQWADAIHRVDPSLKLGGPVFAGDDDVQIWADGRGRTSWLTRFVDYLRAHGRLQDLSFVSMEHYPADACPTNWDDLFREPTRTNVLLNVPKLAGLSHTVPLLVTEYNFSSDFTAVPMDTLGALWQADFIGAFLTGGGDGAYFYEYEPLPLSSGPGNCWGMFGMFAANQQSQITAITAQYFSSAMIHKEWAQPVDGIHRVYDVDGNLVDKHGRDHVTAYALHRPDGEWSVLFVNKDERVAHPIQIHFADSEARWFRGPVTMISFGVQNYAWHPDRENGYPWPDGPAVTSTVPGGPAAKYILPPGSITVLRGDVPRLLTSAGLPSTG